jgi:hypothetical protein
MRLSSLFDSSSWLSRLLQGLLGLLGFYAAVRFLPRLLRSMTRRFVLGLVGEILLVAVSLLLTDRARRGAGPDGRGRSENAPGPAA